MDDKLNNNDFFKINVDSFNKVLCFKYINLEDRFPFKKFLEISDDKLFVKKIILYKLERPIISLDDLNNINESTFKEILKQYVHIESLDLFFNFSNEDFYKDFRDAIKFSVEQMDNIYYENENVQSTVLSAVKEISNLHSFVSQSVINLDYLYATQNKILQTQEYMNQLVDSTCIYNKIDFPAIDYASLFAAYNAASNAASYASRVAAVRANLQPQINILTNTLSANKAVLHYIELISSKWDNFQKEYSILKSEAEGYLKEYYWFITPNVDMSIVYDIVLIGRSDDKNKSTKINKLFSDYFLKNDCENLIALVGKWSEIPIFKKRMHIFKDCVNLIKKYSEDINFSNFVVLPLISQIDGIRYDFIKSQGYNIKKDKLYYLDGKRVKVNGKHMHMNDYYRNMDVAKDISNIINDIFLGVLFQSTRYGEDYEVPFHLSRHKIMHGENTDYGHEDYVWRLFMILDIFSELCS